MRIFDTKVQHLKYKVLREVAREAWAGTLDTNAIDIPKRIVPGKVPTMRCCVYKERAILGERVKLAMGGHKDNPNVIEVIDIACDECPMGGYEVTGACRGCLMHRCEDVCKFGAITFDSQHVAHIDKSKCKECGACAKVCPYSAITNHKRPCEMACKVKAITMDENRAAKIDNSKCIECGACVYQCPWGAISDKSYILDVIDLIKKSENNTKYKLYAVVAPSISSQFTYAKLGQVITGLKVLGFHTVVEAALGADMVLLSEARELAEKGFLTSSCCPAFVSYIKKNFPQMVEHISHNLSPMAMISKYIKDTTPGAKVVFIGPCTAKKPRFWTKKSSRTSIPSSRSRSFKPSLTARIWKSRPLPKAFSTMPPISDASLLVAEDSATQSNNLSKSKTSISTSKVALATASTSAASHSSKRAKTSPTSTSSKVWRAPAVA